MLKSKLLRTGAVVIGLLSIAACGQKGPLYLADEEPPANQTQNTKPADEQKKQQEK